MRVDPRVLFPAEWERRWQVLLAEGQLEQAVFELVNRETYVLFDELQERLASVMTVDGPWVFEAAHNVIVWAGMSQEFADLIWRMLYATNRLRLFVGGRRKRGIHVRRIHPTAYQHRQLALPVVTVLRRKYRTRPHWYPMVLCHGRDAPGQERSLILREDASASRFVVRGNSDDLFYVWRGHLPPETVLGGQAT